MRDLNGKHCCECDFCSSSPCDGKPIWVVFLSDADTSHDYYLFCTAHASEAGIVIRTYLAEHPNVTVESDYAESWATIEGARQ